MRNRNHLKLFEPLIISFIWLLLFAAPLFLGQFDDQINWNHVYRSWQNYLPILFLFFVNRFILLPKLFFKNKRLLYVLSVSCLILIMTSISYVNDMKNRSQLGPNQLEQRFIPNNPPNQLPPPPRDRRGALRNPSPRPQPLPQERKPLHPYMSLFIFSVLIVSFDTGLRVSFRLVETEREKAKLEKENVGAQLAFLRNQVSPHFFMNTLNNIHALVDLNTEEAKESIIRLSKLMRHLLYDSEIEKIPLQKEIDFIQNYVDLMKLRFSDKVKINLKLPEQLPDKSIPPLLFTSYVENAFKHGISYEHSSYITIVFLYAAGKLTFEIKNSKPNIEKEDGPSGIGIENSRKRLDLIYGDNYSLKTEDNQNEYSVQLSIPL